MGCCIQVCDLLTGRLNLFSNFQMQLKKTLLPFFIITSFTLSAVFPQQKMISGSVTDITTHLGLQGVTVKIYDKQTLTNKKGDFSMSIETDLIKKHGITFTCVGYQKKKLVFAEDGSYQVHLEPYAANLAEVSISAGAETIIEKAIRKIPLNYPGSPFMMTGILRTHHVNKDSLNTYEYFQNDAVLKIYHPSYAKKSDDAQIAVVQNKYKLFKSEKQRPIPVFWINAYLIPGQDFVYLREDFVVRSKMKHFTYTLDGKSVVDGRKVYVVDFESKKKGTTGTLYIDQITYAFVAAKYRRQFDGLFKNNILTRDRNLGFKQVGNKWLLDRFSVISNYTERGYRYSADYKTLSIDTVQVKPLPKDDVIKPYTDDVAVRHTVNDSTWNTYQHLFDKAEKDSLITNIEPPKGFVDQSQMISKTKSGFFKRVLGYLATDNMRYTLKFNRLPLDFAVYQQALDKNISSSSIYTIGSGLQLRLYKGLFIEASSSNNYGLGGIRNQSTEYNLTYNFEVNRHHRLITISPVFGYTKFTSSVKKVTWFTQECFTGGLTVSYALGRKFAVYAGGNYNLNSNVTNQGLLLNTKKAYPYLGILYKIK